MQAIEFDERFDAGADMAVHVDWVKASRYSSANFRFSGSLTATPARCTSETCRHVAVTVSP